MKLDTEFYQLPLIFDIQRLQEEIAQFSETDWLPHPQGFPGNSALLLISAMGDAQNDSIKGEMHPTHLLKRCPYLQQVLAAFNTVLGRTRLMRISGGGEVMPHIDEGYYWLQRIRIHIPIVTNPEVQFICGDRSVNMKAGEAWIFDNWRHHQVINPNPEARIHLVADTVGSPFFWNLVAQSNISRRPQLINYDRQTSVKLATEIVNYPTVMTPWEQKCHISFILEELHLRSDNSPQATAELEAILSSFYYHWQCLWMQYADKENGWAKYQAALDNLKEQIKPLHNKLQLNNGADAVRAIYKAIVNVALDADLNKNNIANAAVRQLPSKTTLSNALPTNITSKIERPIFVVCAPRSGSTLLFETLSLSPSVWTIGGESHGVFESIAALKPAQKDYHSNMLSLADVTPEIAAQIKANFIDRSRDRNGNPLDPNLQQIRLLEKTPKNALRISFLNAIFPDALFIYLHREPKANISSIIEAWKSNRFVTYPQLPGWNGEPWSLLLVPQWQKLNGKSLAQIATAQWIETHEAIMNSLQFMDAKRWQTIGYEDLIKNPQAEIKRLCQFADIAWDRDLSPGSLALSKFTLTPPQPDKWKQNEAVIAPLLAEIQPTCDRLKQMCEQHYRVLS